VFEEGVALGALLLENPVGLVELRFVGTLGLDVTDDALQTLVDDEGRAAARAGDFKFSS
jgi:hypothetical protein